MEQRFRPNTLGYRSTIGSGPESGSDGAGMASGGSARRADQDRRRIRLSRRRDAADAGSVTVEAALVLPALVLVLVLCLAGIGCVSEQLRCVDAAREAARLAGRGDTSAAMAAATSIAPDGAAISIVMTGDLVEVTVSASPLGGLLPGVRVGATSVAAAESVLGPAP